MSHTPANTPASGGDELREALKPFADAWRSCQDIGEQGGGHVHDEQDAWVSGHRDGGAYPLFKFGDLARAAAALAAQPPQADGGVVQAFLPQPNETREDKLLREGLEWRDMYIRASAERDRLLDAAALAAQPPQADGGVVPAGWKCVPEEPTPEMIRAARAKAREVVGGGLNALAFEDCWEAALAAAPPLNTGSAVGGGFQPKIETCPKCGAKGVAFVCDQKGCPVNGGAAYPWSATAEAGKRALTTDEQAKLSAALIASTEPAYEIEASAPAEAGDDLAGRAEIVDLCNSVLGDAFLGNFEEQNLARRVKKALTTPASRPAEQGEPVASVEQVVSRLIIANPDKARQAIQTPEKWGWFCGRIAESGLSYEVGKQHLYALLSALEAPAASRPAVGRTDFEAKLKQLLHWHLRPDFTRDAIDSLEHEILCLLLNPRDDTRAGGDDAQEGGWLPIETAPTDRPIAVRMPSRCLPSGWFVTTAWIPDPDDDDNRLSGCSTIYNYNGEPLLTRFRGTWTHWRKDAPPAADAQEGGR